MYLYPLRYYESPIILRQMQKQGNNWCRRACASGNPQPGHCDRTWPTWVHKSPGALLLEAMEFQPVPQSSPTFTMHFAPPSPSTQTYHSAQSEASTQPFSSDEVLEAVDMALLVHSLMGTRASSSSPPFPIDLGLVRIFARSRVQQHVATMTSYPDKVPATVLDHGILAVSQSSRSVGCDLHAATFHVRLYFNPCQDTLTAHNLSSRTMLVVHSKSQGSLQLAPRAVANLQPGSWTFVSPARSNVPEEWLDLFLARPKFWLTPNPTPELTGTKRRRGQVQDSNKHKMAPDRRYIQSSAHESHPLLELSTDDQVSMNGPLRDDKYTVKCRKPLFSNSSASLYTADYSLRPGQVVVVKAFKPTVDISTLAERWHKEVTAHLSAGPHVSHTLRTKFADV